MDAGLLGVLGLVVNLAELGGAIPFGLLADRFSPRLLLVGSGLLGAAATQLFGMSGVVAIFLLSRTMEGISAGASGPPLLAHLADITQDAPLLRGRVMGVFELSVLAGLALGGLGCGWSVGKGHGIVWSNRPQSHAGSPVPTAASGNISPFATSSPPSVRGNAAKLIGIPVLNGLHHSYCWAT